MRIAVISDTHSFRHPMLQAVKAFKDIDLLIHLGDIVDDVEFLASQFSGRIINVRGNCDLGSFIPSERVEIIEGKKFFLTHGDKYNVKNTLMSLKYKAQELQADVVLFGHTHRSMVEFENGIWFINPGSPSTALNRRNSFAVIDIEEGEIKPSIIEI